MTLLGQKKKDHYVVYRDGRRSELMDKSTAESYARIFGGVVVSIRGKKLTVIEKLIKRIMQL